MPRLVRNRALERGIQYAAGYWIVRLRDDGQK
jgi:hypothetical protein